MAHTITPRAQRVVRSAGSGACSAIALLVACFTVPPAGAEDLAANEVIAGRPYSRSLQERLGHVICARKDTGTATDSIYFQSNDGSILTVVVNRAPWAADVSQVIAATVDRNPSLPQSCARPGRASLSGQSYHLAAPRGLIRLGDNQKHVLAVLGDPDAITRSESVLQWDYSLDRDASHKDVWSLTFTDGRLTGWTLRTFLVFYELAG